MRIAILRRLPANARVGALRDALAIAPESEREAIATELIEIASMDQGESPMPSEVRVALSAVMRSWPRVPASVRSAAAATGGDRWAEIMDLARSDASMAKGGVLVASDLRGDIFAPGLVSLLASEDAEVGDGAARALLSLAVESCVDAGFSPGLLDGVFGESGDPSGKGEQSLLSRLERDPSLGAAQVLGQTGRPQSGLACDPARIAHSLAEACWRFAEHRRRDPLRAALLVLGSIRRVTGDGAARLNALARASNHPGASALRGEIRWSRSPVMRLVALRLLGEPSIAQACRDRISTAESDAEHEAVLRASHLALHPAREAALRLCKPKVRARAEGVAGRARVTLAPGGPLPIPSQTVGLSEAARAGLPRLSRAMSLPVEAPWGVIEPMLIDPSPATRLASSRLVGAEDLHDFCFDEHRAVAGHAALRWAVERETRIEGHQPSFIRRLGRSQHAGVRAIGADAGRWRDPLSCAGAGAALGLRRWLRANRAELAQAMSQAIREAPIARAIEAVRVAERLGIVDDAQDAIIAAARSPEIGDRARLAASAAQALGSAEGQESLRGLQFCLSHRDQRVRANAVEALAKRAARRRMDTKAAEMTVSVLVELKDDEHHRVRANAIRGLVDVVVGGRQAGKGSTDIGRPLGSMLEDPAPLVRRAGLWALHRIASRLHEPDPSKGAGALDEFARFVERLAEDDPDAAVRARASSCVLRLTRDQRRKWAGAARSLESSAPLYTGYEHRSGARFASGGRSS